MAFLAQAMDGRSQKLRVLGEAPSNPRAGGPTRPEGRMPGGRRPGKT